MKNNVVERTQQGELKVLYPDLPEWIAEVVKETIAKNSSQCLDPVKAKGNCLRMSDQLLYNLSEVNKEAIVPFVNCKIMFRKKPHPHFWLLVDGWHIDLTAKQFDRNEPCPKIWRDGETNLGNVYTVEKGRDMVLFYLTPFKYGKAKKPRHIHQISSFIFLLKKFIRLPRRILEIPGKSLIPFR